MIRPTRPRQCKSADLGQGHLCQSQLACGLADCMASVWSVLLVCVDYICRHAPLHLAQRISSSWPKVVQRTKAFVSSFYEAFAGLAGLAFYYYDLITSIIVLRQVWGLWPSKVLLAIFLVHFATTGVIVAFHALYRLIKLRYDVSQSGYGLGAFWQCHWQVVPS